MTDLKKNKPLIDQIEDEYDNVRFPDSIIRMWLDEGDLGHVQWTRECEEETLAFLQGLELETPAHETERAQYVALTQGNIARLKAHGG